MFQFPAFASCTYIFNARYLKEVGFPIQKSSDQSLFAAPQGLSQRTTSFIACMRQGIHQTPLRHLITLIFYTHPLKESSSNEVQNQHLHPNTSRKECENSADRYLKACFFDNRARLAQRADKTQHRLTCQTSFSRYNQNHAARQWLAFAQNPKALSIASSIHNVRNNIQANKLVKSVLNSTSLPNQSTHLFWWRHPSARSQQRGQTKETSGWRHQNMAKPDFGGARRDRTDDLMLAKHALSQLSYGP